MDNYFTGSKDNLKQWIGHPRFELIRHGAHFSHFLLTFSPFIWFCSSGFKSINFFVADVTEPLLVEVDQIYHLACPASPIFYKYNPVKVSVTEEACI